MAKEILVIVEDKGFVANLLTKRLTQKGYDVALSDHSRAADYMRDHRPSMLLLEAPATRSELMTLCLTLRDMTAAPLIVICDSPVRLEDLEAVECVTKPLDFRRLFAVMESSLTSQRRRKPRATRYLRAGDLSLDLQKQTLTHGDHQCDLTPKEFLLLRMFLNNSGQVLTHKAIMKEVWSTDYTDDKRTLQVHISWIRRKIEDDPAHPQYLRTVRGVGYRFDAEP
jgi:DNA-binding response OmpR family regulator